MSIRNNFLKLIDELNVMPGDLKKINGYRVHPFTAQLERYWILRIEPVDWQMMSPDARLDHMGDLDRLLKKYFPVLQAVLNELSFGITTIHHRRTFFYVELFARSHDASYIIDFQYDRLRKSIVSMIAQC
jgi:hypothetical protein